MRTARELSAGDPWRLGGYRLAGRLGAGARGVVYEGYDAAGRRVTVNVVHGRPAIDPGLRARLVREAEAARGVAPFCVAGVLDADFDGPRPYLVSEYVEGPSLRRAGRVLGGEDLRALAVAVATALTALHDAGVIHRDLTPDTVIVGPDGPRVTGFGVAPGLEAALAAPALKSYEPSYLAPEVFTAGPPGPAADVFAWGAVVLYAATGQDAFAAGSLGAVMHRVLSLDPDLDPLPPSLRPLASAALSKEPGARPSARELLRELLDLPGGPSGPPGPPGSPGGVPRVTGADRAPVPEGVALLRAGAETAARVRTACDDPSLGELAEAAYAALDPAVRGRAPAVFLRLVTVAADGEAVAREVRASPAAESVLGGFTGTLVRRRAGTYVLSPALPYAWPRLRGWIDAGRGRLVARDRLARLLPPLLAVSAVLTVALVTAVIVAGWTV
ncbi:protein kinase [Streptosporangium sp. NPDC023615]|uniref:protein kinase domain-containing protein n=1 Tax=Streptosporangium sp. NPDC023615 TaxID=3154794 RepID=UPI003421B9CB